MASGLGVLNNLAALNTNNQLKTNNRNRDKNMSHISSGMKIAGAKDDASSYAISEKMRVQIRGLDQCERNSENGKSLLKVAEGALSSIKEIATTIKERTINAANDHNTDEDREAIQQEIEQMIDQIDEISYTTTFNGEYILDGSQELHSTLDHTPKGLVLRGLNTWWISEGIDLIRESYGLDFSDASVNEMTVKFTEDPNNSALAWVTSAYSPATKPAIRLEMTVNMSYFNNITAEDENGIKGGGIYLDRVIAHELTHAVMSSNMAMLNMPDWLVEGMAELTHGADERLLGSLAAGKNITALLDKNGGAFGSPTGDEAYSGGYIALRYLEKQCGSGTIGRLQQFLSENGRDCANVNDLLDNAIAGVSHGRYKNVDDFYDKIMTDFNGITGLADSKKALKEKCDIDLDNNDTGALVGIDASGRRGIPLTDKSIIDEGGGSYGRLPKGTTKINGLNVIWPDIGGGFYGGLVLQTGLKSGQHLIIDLREMNAGTLGLRSLDVRTQYSAQRAIDRMDQAVDKVTRQATIVGAYQKRLEFTIENLVTASENTTGSESTIRDADMAKEMTSYTKYQLLVQSTQAMLSQANQQPQAVLSLLQ